MINPVIIFGAKGLAKAALECFKSNGVEVYAFLDNDEQLHGEMYGDVSVLGATDDDGFLKLIGKKCDAFVAIEDQSYRTDVIEMLLERRKVMPANAIHRDTSLPTNLHMGHGNFINAGVTIGADAKIGNHCIINSGCTIDYSVEIGDDVQIGAGSAIGAGVEIGSNAIIGTGSIIMPGVKIGNNAKVGPGSVVIGAVKANQVVFGNPAKAVER